MRSHSEAVGRALALALAASVCGGITMGVSLVAQQVSLPPSDGAYGLPWWSALDDPFVRAVAVPVAVICAGLGWITSLFTLMRTRLRATVPIVTAAAVVTAALTSVKSSFIAAPLALFVACTTMIALRPRARQNGRDPHRQSGEAKP